MSVQLILKYTSEYITKLSAFSLMALFSTPLFAVEPPAKEATCRACHGVKGAAPIMASYPKLNGQNQAYLEQSLNAYRNDQRSGGMAAVMAAQAKMLNAEEITALSAYYAAQK